MGILSSINRDSFGLVGDIGVVLYSIYLLVCLWRLYYVYSCNDTGNVYKNAFHYCIALSAFFNLIYYIAMAVVNAVTAFGYCFHVVAVFFETAAFLAVVLYWSLALSFFGKFEHLLLFNQILLLQLAAVSIACIIILCVYGFDNTHANRFLGLIALDIAITLFFSAVWILVYGLRLQWRLHNHTKVVLTNAVPDDHSVGSSGTADRSGASDKRSLPLTRINIVLVVCVVCYFFRAFTSTMVFLWDMHVVRNQLGWLTALGWYICTEWVAELFPILALLWVIRPRDPGQRAAGSLQDETESNLDGDTESNYELRVTGTGTDAGRSTVGSVSYANPMLIGRGDMSVDGRGDMSVDGIRHQGQSVSSSAPSGGFGASSMARPANLDCSSSFISTDSVEYSVHPRATSVDNRYSSYGVSGGYSYR